MPQPFFNKRKRPASNAQTRSKFVVSIPFGSSTCFAVAPPPQSLFLSVLTKTHARELTAAGRLQLNNKGEIEMAMPDYQTFMLPLLRFYGDGREHAFREAVEALAKTFRLTDAERREMLPSGQQAVFDNRVGWARTYMKKAGLLDAPKRGVNKITERGLEILKSNPTKLDVDDLSQFQEFKDFKALRHAKADDMESDTDTSHKTPEESLEGAYQKIRGDLAVELLQRLKSCSPSFFERLEQITI